MRARLSMAIAAAGLLTAAAPSMAHHSFNAEFDGTQPIRLEGVVVKMEWINPHSWITMEVKKADGTVETWRVEAGAPNAMFRRGFRKDSLPIGTVIIVDGYRAKNGSALANGKDLTFPDGRKLFMGSSGTGAPYDTPERK